MTGADREAADPGKNARESRGPRRDLPAVFTALCTVRPNLWALWQAVGARLAEPLPPMQVWGLTGLAIHNTDVALNGVALEAMLLPGLAALGLEAELQPLPEDPSELRPLLRAVLRTGSVPLFSCPSEEAAPVSAQPLITAVAPGARDAVTLQDSAGGVCSLSSTALRERGTHLLRLRRGGVKGPPRANRLAAVARWAAFEAAFPECTVSADEPDASAHALAGEFLRLIAGSRRDRGSNLLRRAAAIFDEPWGAEDLMAAFDLLREQTCLALQLPTAQANAILASPERPLTDLERRELIYLARAGTRDLKRLAARRLTWEREHSDAERTLEQLLYDPDPLVRAVVRVGLETA